MDISPTGPIASFAGLVFLVIFALAPRRGFLANWLKRSRQRSETSELLVLEFVSQGGRRAIEGIAIPRHALARALTRLVRDGMIRETSSDLEVTERGHRRLLQAFQG